MVQNVPGLVEESEMEDGGTEEELWKRNQREEALERRSGSISQACLPGVAWVSWVHWF